MGLFQALMWRTGQAIGWLVGTGLGWYVGAARLTFALARQREWRKAGIFAAAHIAAIGVVVLAVGVIWAIVLVIVAGIALEKLVAGLILRSLGYAEPGPAAESIDDAAASLTIARNKNEDPRLRLANLAGLVDAGEHLDVLAGILAELGEREQNPFETALIRALAARVEAERGNFPTARVESEAARAAIANAIGLTSEESESFTARGLTGLSEEAYGRWAASLSQVLAEPLRGQSRASHACRADTRLNRKIRV